MTKRLTKKIIFILICVSLFTILFSCNVFAADNDEEIYTIEDIIFNKIPILDVNFFSDTAGGQPVTDGSVVDIIRNVVSTWYVSIRNLVIVVLALGIIYIGIRMALATIPSKKADYKKMIIGWIQSLVIVLTIHYLMVLIINFNDVLLETLQNAEANAMLQFGSSETTIYDTIRTRAYSLSFTASIPAMIMYIALIIIWVKFLWVYIKRMFTVLILVVIAPFIGVKYAIEAASGKKGTSFTTWIFDFTMNVLLQSVHALVYTALVSVALTLSTESLMGFVIALVFLNFMLKADEIFRNIFNFDKSSLAHETGRKEKMKDVVKGFAGITFVGQMATSSVGFVKGVGNIVTKTGKGIYKHVSPNTKDLVNEKLDTIDLALEQKFNKPSEDGKLNDFNNMMTHQFKVRRLSRQKGSSGIRAKTLKRKLSAQRKKRYNANFKFVKDTLVASGSVVLAIPMTVVNPAAGVTMLTKGVKTLKKNQKKNYDINYDINKNNNTNENNKKQSVIGKKALKLCSHTGVYKTYYGQKKAKEKYEKKRNKIYKTIDNIDEIDADEKKIKEKYNNIITINNANDNEIKDFKEAITKVVIEANSSRIMNIIDNYVKLNNIDSIDNSTINVIIEEVMKELGLSFNLRFDNNIIDKIKGETISIILSKKGEDKAKSKKENIAIKVSEKASEDVIENTIDDKFKNIGKDIAKLEEKINKAERDTDTVFRHANKFIENL